MKFTYTVHLSGTLDEEIALQNALRHKSTL